MFEPLPARFDFPAAEKKVREFWEQHNIFRRSLEQRAGAPRFIFYEGPPTANGLPHPGHCLTRAMKDIFPRYKTMTGHYCERKAGWDTHGLPVEVEVCKALGIHSKEEIEKFGVEKFVRLCIESVFKYTREWEELTRRLGFWVNLDEAYVTYHQSYVESVWWSLKTLFERGLLYQGHKVVWWWAQGGTALSAGEVGEGYREVDDPSVFVKFPLVQATGGAEVRRHEGTKVEGERLLLPEKTSLLVWTTTPWTLISNHFAAVHPDLEYALVYDGGADEHFIVASILVEAIGKKAKRTFDVRGTYRGAELLGLRYRPPYSEVYYDFRRSDNGSVDLARQALDRALRASGSPDGTPAGDAVSPLRGGGSDYIGWRVVAADFVTTDSGTGVVHEAPAFGEVDFNLLQEERKRFGLTAAGSADQEFAEDHLLPLLCAVRSDGTFDDAAPSQYRGRWVKDCDKDIIRELRDVRRTPWGTPLLFHQETYRHDYPFCPRAPEDALIQYARSSWFVRTSQFKDEMLRNNAKIRWLPEHIREGRFGDFLRNNVDWALSRERFWGTPLPIWKCETCGRMEAIGSFAELKGKPGATDATDEYPQGFWNAKVEEHRAAGDPPLPDHLRVHKPYIDAWTYQSSCCASAGARMRRVPEVIDCWWDAGSMPFAQWGFPHAPGSVTRFVERLPADFISEALDQTRGWFYGLVAISTLLFGYNEGAWKHGRELAERCGEADNYPTRERYLAAMNAEARPPLMVAHSKDGGTCVEQPYLISHDFPLPFETCIVLGIVMGEDGLKMSKRTKNYREPTYIFDTLGADAMRWYFFSAQAPWTSVRFQEAAIRDAQREFLVKLYNVLSFFTIYASIDGFDPSKVAAPKTPDGFVPVGKDLSVQQAEAAKRMGWRPSSERTELDRWIITELRNTVVAVRESMDRFENFPAAQRLSDFVEALSNWYVRRSRERFWRPASASDQAKWDAYHTLYGCLRVLSRLIAPFTPFFAETMHQHLRVPGDPDSVHLCDYPTAEEIGYGDDSLAATMDTVRDLVALGRAARTGAKLKVRQPLARVEVILADPARRPDLESHAALIAEELNVKQVEFTDEAEHYVSYKVTPNFKAIGARFRTLVPAIKEALGKLADPAAARKSLVGTGKLALNIAGQVVELTTEDVDIRPEAKPGWSAAQGRAGVVVLSTEITPELRDEGVVRELIHHVQARRKELELPYDTRIELSLSAGAEFVALVRRFESTIRSECLAARIEYPTRTPDGAVDLNVEGHSVRMLVTRM